MCCISFIVYQKHDSENKERNNKMDTRSGTIVYVQCMTVIAEQNFH
jgi:hypothetical protein